MLVQLQYVRAIAALVVVYFHSVLQLHNVHPGAVLGSVVFGEYGVDLFFVLSGFVMWLTTANRKIGPVEFYKHRIERIVPLYWALTLAAAAIALLLPAYLKSTQFDLPHLLASLFFIPWVNPAEANGGMIAPVIIPGWTLNYEMYFYLIFGALLLLPENRRIAALFAVVGGIFLVAHAIPGNSTASMFYGYSVVFEFLAGVVVARLYLARVLIRPRRAVILAGLGTVVLIWADCMDLAVPRVVAAGVPSVVIIYSLVSLDFSKIREFRFLHRLGDASYSLYLTHVFTLVGVRIGYRMLPFDWMKNEVLFVAICIVASVIVALFVYRFYERPFAAFFKGQRQAKKASGGYLSARETA
ncbi:acyltransferase family protein [Roseibium aggregatum]|uniref:Acyltransferase n=1 Tax=Roseibium aggregatum TaxID=187304 RepID=A0A926NX28_9HYPH|nr:acyltransferase [Roseibium aggregatum]MBD1548952.1 acyltransferase [Roseibium aggregatum]